MAKTFQPAQRARKKARIGLIGPSGSGKTIRALEIANSLGDRIAVIDTEHESASIYAGSGDGEYTFDSLCLDDFAPAEFIRCIKLAEKAGYDVVILDSLSHAWEGVGGVREIADVASAKYGGNTFFAWRDATPHHRALIEAMLKSKCHIIATMRAETEYVQETDSSGRKVVRKIGLAPIQRKGMDYEFDITADINVNHVMTISKTRWREIDGKSFSDLSGDFGTRLRNWLENGVEKEEEKPRLSFESFEQIKALFAALGHGDDKIADAVSKRGVSRLEDLSEAQAEEMIIKLNMAVEKVKGKAKTEPTAAEPPPVVAPAAETPPVTATPPHPRLLVGEATMKLINNLFVELGTTKEKIASALETRGVSTLAELTQEQAVVMLANLQKNLAKIETAKRAEEKAAAATPVVESPVVHPASYYVDAKTAEAIEAHFQSLAIPPETVKTLYLSLDAKNVYQLAADKGANLLAKLEKMDVRPPVTLPALTWYLADATQIHQWNPKPTASAPRAAEPVKPSPVAVPAVASAAKVSKGWVKALLDIFKRGGLKDATIMKILEKRNVTVLEDLTQEQAIDIHTQLKKKFDEAGIPDASNIVDSIVYDTEGGRADEEDVKSESDVVHDDDFAIPQATVGRTPKPAEEKKKPGRKSKANVTAAAMSDEEF